jgi:hypothetical protein
MFKESPAPGVVLCRQSPFNDSNLREGEFKKLIRYHQVKWMACVGNAFVDKRGERVVRE